MVSYHCPASLLTTVAADIDEELAYEDSLEHEGDEATGPETAVAAAVPVFARRDTKRSREAVARERILGESGGVLVELRR
ncbi:hypothetical protein P3T76_001948 [Phytophthora citrophthora]|uniref:Uncharacterized protein n=1 Tax=Phytophthora citrophthora TaxID=4793 RepID=A0AAD9GXL7_9STRA|nr:hypothetical protein P3T76_001948 [Phytophthora citrophthora]